MNNTPPNAMSNADFIHSWVPNYKVLLGLFELGRYAPLQNKYTRSVAG